MVTITIPRHIRTIELSKSQRAKHWEWNGNSIKHKNKKLLKKFLRSTYSPPIPSCLKDEYCMGVFKGSKLLGVFTNHDALFSYDPITQKQVLKNEHKLPKGIKIILVHKDTDEPVLVNPKKAGKPRIHLIKGQDIYSNKNKFTRAKVMDAIKDQMRDVIKKLNITPITEFPVKMSMLLYDTPINPYDQSTVNGGFGKEWDIDNYAYPYTKAFPDVLQELGIIPNDDRFHITQPPVPLFCPIDNHDERKLVFIIELDSRDIITNNGYYNGDILPVIKKETRKSGKSITGKPKTVVKRVNFKL